MSSLHEERRIGLGGAAALGAFVSIALGTGNASAWTLDTLHAFCKQTGCTDGKAPQTALVMADKRHFYGTTPEGGAKNEGTVYELVHKKDGTWNYNVIYSFCAKTNCADGSQPLSDLIVDKDGILYGTTFSGGGIGAVYQLQHTSTGWQESVIYKFCSSGTCSDGESPYAGLSYAGQSTGAPWDHFSPLFGTANNGGTFNHGVAYKLISDGSLWNEEVIHNFKTGIGPSALLVDSAGNLYGDTSDGGLHNNAGLVFKLAHDTWTETIIHNFCAETNCADGENGASVRPAIDAGGNVYGTTVNGGGGGGVIFRISPTGSYSVIHKFPNVYTTGETPLGGVLVDSSGDLFAPLEGAGPNINPTPRAGTLVKLHHGGNGWVVSVLYVFCSKQNCNDGGYPRSGVIFDASGDLLGTTQKLGSHNGGTVFELTP